MIMILGDRCSGKTIELIKRFLDDPHGIFVTYNDSAATKLKSTYPARKKDITSISFLNTRCLSGQHYTTLYLDEPEMYFKRLGLNVVITDTPQELKILETKLSGAEVYQRINMMGLTEFNKMFPSFSTKV